MQCINIGVGDKGVLVSENRKSLSKALAYVNIAWAWVTHNLHLKPQTQTSHIGMEYPTARVQADTDVYYWSRSNNDNAYRDVAKVI